MKISTRKMPGVVDGEWALEATIAVLIMSYLALILAGILAFWTKPPTVDPETFFIANLAGILGSTLLYTLRYRLLIKNRDISFLPYIIGLGLSFWAVETLGASYLLLLVNLVFLWRAYIPHSYGPLRLSIWKICRLDTPQTDSKRNMVGFPPSVFFDTILVLVTYGALSRSLRWIFREGVIPGVEVSIMILLIILASNMYHWILIDE